MIERRPPGVSLLEALITLGLVGMLLGLCGSLLVGYFRVLKFSAAKDNSWLAAQVGIQRSVGELRETVAVITPSPGGTATELRFRKLDPGATDPDNSAWLPKPIPSPVPVAFDPYPPGLLLEVCYRSLGDGRLIREVGPAGSAPTSTESLCEGVSGFRCDSLADGSYLLVVSVQEEKLVRTLTSRALPEVP